MDKVTVGHSVVTVGMLAAALKTLDQEAELYMSEDNEGNGFHSFEGIDASNPKKIILWPKHDHIEDEELE